MTKENKYLRDTINRLRKRYGDEIPSISASAKKERNTIYASLKSKEYKFDA